MLERERGEDEQDVDDGDFGGYLNGGTPVGAVRAGELGHGAPREQDARYRHGGDGSLGGTVAAHCCEEDAGETSTAGCAGILTGDVDQLAWRRPRRPRGCCSENRHDEDLTTPTAG